MLNIVAYSELYDRIYPSMHDVMILYLPISPRGSTLEFDVYRRQILTSKDDPRTERMQIFIMAVHP